MKLYRKECRRIADSVVYFLFIAILIFSWFQNFKGVTKTEIDWADGKNLTEIGFDRPLLKKPTPKDEFFGSKLSEDDPNMIMTGVTRALLKEYKSNSYATYPLGYYKAITLNKEKQKRVLEILCEITGLTEKQLENLPKDYFPAVTGTIFSYDTNETDTNKITEHSTGLTEKQLENLPKDYDANKTTDRSTGLTEKQLENLAKDYDANKTTNRSTGLTEKQLENLSKDYDTNKTTDHSESMRIATEKKQEEDSDNHTDKTQKFVSQVTYEHFQVLMKEMETLIGENGSKYSKEMMITYFGLSEMNYEEASSEYQQTIQNDRVTGGFARLFCDYMGLALGFYPVFLAVMIWLKDRTGNIAGSTAELIYSRKISSLKLVLVRYLANITMVFLPVFLLSLESLLPLISFGAKHRIAIDYLAYVKYILWWLLPTVMIVTAIGMFFTLLTDSPIAVVVQFLWWLMDNHKGVAGLSGNTHLLTLIIRHNTLRGSEIIQNGFYSICMNRLLMTGISILLVCYSVWILEKKRKGKINAANIYKKCFVHLKNKLPVSHTT